VSIFGSILPWYLAIQLCTVAVLPLSLRFFQALPERGYAFTKILGVFLVGLILWLGTSYGLLRNEFGGAWIAVSLAAILSYAFGGYGLLRKTVREAGRGAAGYVIGVEALFAVAFLVWAVVRAHDPAANHTEQPMDLMFMNSIWTSPTFPPNDAWLTGYPISYYYLGYWLLITLGHLSSTPPALAYNVGQASWYGLLLLSAFGLGYNLFSLGKNGDTGEASDEEQQTSRWQGIGPAAAGLLTAVFVGVVGNLQVIVEWLYAQGVNLGPFYRWLAVNGFPDNAQQSGKWFIGSNWWWWRSSRVLSDQDLSGNHIEVIDEFPMFSYILGDNHPHVLAMPVVILVIAMALTVFLGAMRDSSESAEGKRLPVAWEYIKGAIPMGLWGLMLVAAVSGGLVFLNTWDYPPYWLLLIASLFVGLSVSQTGRATRGTGVLLLSTIVFGIVLAIATLGIYLPYFLTAQSQAGGILPNLFNPSRIQQVMLMFGAFIPAIIGLIIWFWRDVRPGAVVIITAIAVVIGAPIAFLAFSSAVFDSTSLSTRVPLPSGAASHLPFILERWTSRPLTFLTFGLALAVCLAILWSIIRSSEVGELPRVHPFLLLVVAIGLLLIYLPEFIYLRDNFGSRMNTVFKFYYQAWLVLAIGAAYMTASALFRWRNGVPRLSAALSFITLVAATAALLFPAAGAYSKTNGFTSTELTLDAVQYVAYENPAELAAVYWVLANTDPDAVVLEGKGASYRANYSRVSSMTGRGTLLGWDGHEAQWRGASYGEMAAGRGELLDSVYRTARPDEIPAMLDTWGIDYVYVGPTEWQQYGMNPRSESRLAEAMALVYDRDGVRIYQRR